MRILIVTPAPEGTTRGNRVTAVRWAKMLGQMGHVVEVASNFERQESDLLIALHACRSAEAVRLFAEEFPDRPIILVLTGTDVYGGMLDQPLARKALNLALRIVGLHSRILADLPVEYHAKTRVIVQSADLISRESHQRDDVFEVCVLGHLRPVKDPFRAALAARLLPAASLLTVLHLGEALSDEMRIAAAAEARTNPRYRWLGSVPRSEALTILASCRLMVLTSQFEGGPSALSEAVMLGVPVVSSRIAAVTSILGDDYPGLFEIGDTVALAKLLTRCESDPVFLQELSDRCRMVRDLFDPARERRRWEDLLRELD